MIDLASHELGIEPTDLRRINTIPSDAMPFKTGLTFTYDSGEFEKNMDMALEMSDYDNFEKRRNWKIVKPKCSQNQKVAASNERVFDNRTAYVSQLRQLGAKIIDGGQTVIIDGGVPLTGTTVRALDIRAGASVVIGGLAASGTTKILGIEHLDRGYAHLTKRLVDLGADVKRYKESITKD